MSLALEELNGCLKLKADYNLIKLIKEGCFNWEIKWYIVMMEVKALCWLKHFVTHKGKLLSRVRLCVPKDCSLSGSLVHGTFQARVLEWVAISFSIVNHKALCKYELFLKWEFTLKHCWLSSILPGWLSKGNRIDRFSDQTWIVELQFIEFITNIQWEV